MNGPMGDTTSGAFEKSGRREVLLTLGTSRGMVVLVRPIVNDILQAGRRLAQLRPELDRLDRQRHTLGWPERARRYQVREEVASLEKCLHEATAELNALGVALLDPEQGRVGFPTIVNDRRAFFSWKPSEEGISHWHYAGDHTLRSIPSSWSEPKARKVRGKR